MRYLSVCSGIEAASVAWHDLGWEAVGYSEIEKFPSEVLNYHYPTVPNLGDMTKYKEWNIGTVDLIVGGTPCQSFSVAGLRKGLEDPRGNLALTYVGLLDHFRPQWFIWENVPGVLSSGGGRDFGSFLGAVAELGYGFAYRVLDAQYFGVPQRRRRVFVVGHLTDWRLASQVLFEPESLSGNTKSSRKTREDIASFVESSFGQYRQDPIAGTTKASGGVLGGGSETFLTVYENHPSDSRVKDMGEVCQTVTSTWGMGGGNVPFVQSLAIRTANTNANGHGIANEVSHTLDGAQGQAVAYGFEPGIAKREGNLNRFSEELSPTLRADMGDNQAAVAVGVDVYNQTISGQTAATMTEACGGTNTSGPKVMQNMAVRRLTPIECERLQGFPDDYTNIPWRGKEVSPDGSRYKALGNSMAVPVMRWIGTRIKLLTSL